MPSELIARAEGDPHRPRYHFVAPAGWLNDPNGLCRWGDTYHLFYQHFPTAPIHRDMHWGHATSSDLVHWRHEPVALAPGEDGPDSGGCWSGVLVNDNGTPTIVYSGHNDEVGQRSCLAIGDPDLRTWRKDPANPVIPDPPADLDLVAYRDHCVWHDGQEWNQLIGAGIRGEGGTALLYSGPDLRTWRYRGPIHVGDANARSGVWTGTMWECVDLFELDDRHVLMFSTWSEGGTHYPAYLTGHYANGRFTPDPGDAYLFDYGLRFCYAPQSMRDADGRRVVLGWMQEGRPNDAVLEAGWSGVMSLPRVPRIGTDGQLHHEPAAEVATLRRDHVRVSDVELRPGPPTPLSGIHGDQLDLEARFMPSHDAVIELAIRESPDGSERTVIVLDAANGELRLDRTHSSQDPAVDAEPRQGPLPIGPDGVVELRVLIDHSALEIFANGRALTARVYPTRPDALGVSVGAARGEAGLAKMDAWTMADIWT